jgi:hypothetical protein
MITHLELEADDIDYDFMIAIEAIGGLGFNGEKSFFSLNNRFLKIVLSIFFFTLGDVNVDESKFCFNFDSKKALC